jgi:hypothetical protein
MNENERNGLEPIARNTSTTAARRCPLAAARRARPVDLSLGPPPSLPTPAPGVPLLLRDPTYLVRCSRREALGLLAGIALLSTPAVVAPDDPPQEDAYLRQLEARFAGDSRLDQKLSLTAWSEPLEDLLARLSREIGVPFRSEGRDVGDQRVNLVLKDQSLRRALALLADVLDLYWRRERKEGGYRYVLFQHLRSRKREQELLSRAHDRFRQGVRRLVESLKLTPQEIEKLQERAFGWARRLTDPDRRKAIELLGRFAPPYWERLMQSGHIKLPYASLSSRDQELVREYLEVVNSEIGQRNRIAKQELEAGTPGEHHVGDVTQPGGQVVIKIWDGVPPGPDSTFDVILEPANGRSGGNGLGLGYTPEERTLLHDEFSPLRFEKDPRVAPDELGPRVTITWKEKPEVRWEEVLKGVVRGADLQLISDSYLYYWTETNSDLPDRSSLQDRPLTDVLDRIAAPFSSVWRREGDVYLFRHRYWFLEKSHNIPERDIRRWYGHLEAHGRLLLEDLTDLALLTDRQLFMLSRVGIINNWPRSAARRHRELLRFYAALNPLQGTRLETTGLRLSDLTAPQVELLRAWKLAASVDANARLGLRREPEAVVFTLAADATAPQEERVPLEPGKPPASD